LRRIYRLSTVQYNELVEASKWPEVLRPSLVPYSVHLKANAAWKKLGDEMRFEHMTVQLSAYNPMEFTAIEKEIYET